MSRVTVKDIAEKFMWEVVCGKGEALQRPVTLADTNRPGLELAGYFPGTQVKRLVVLGDKEIGYIQAEMDEISQRRAFEYLTGPKTPAIVVTNSNPCPEILKEIAQRKNFPICTSDQKTSHVIVNVTNYLDEMLAQSVILHGELVRVYGVGVLITGKSGTGKSEIVLELIQRGHQLVADDRVDCYRIHNQLIGRPTPMIEGFMELRGVGIIDVEKMYGVASITHQTNIDLEIVLEPFRTTSDYDRVGIEEKEYSEILGIRILKMRIPVSAGRPMSTIIETAVTNYLLLIQGTDSAKEFEERVLAEIAHNRDEDLKEKKKNLKSMLG